MSSHKPWDELSDEERTPEAGYQEAMRRIENCRETGGVELYLDYLQLESLPPEIGELKQLEILYARGNKIVEILNLSTLAHLTWLNLRGNAISEIGALSLLTELKMLVLSHNSINDIGPLAGLTQLTWLNLRNNRIVDIESLAHMKELRLLVLSDNQIVKIESLKENAQLTRCDLSLNQITDLRPIMWGLHSKVTIHFEFSTKDGLYLHGNPLIDPPEEVARQGAQAILDYWDALDQKGQEKNYEGRALIVGRGGVGKTTLLEKLKDEAFELNPNQKQTHGINIWPDCKFLVPGEKAREFHASIWDFGGQDIQHMTHQYFFTPRTVFVLMVNKRGLNAADEAAELNYWFRTIDLLGRYSQEKARVMVVQNVFTTEGTSAGVDLAPYEERYGDSVNLSFHRVNLGAQEAAFADLRKELQKSLLAVPGVGDARVKGWSDIRQVLRECRSEKRISFDRYASICAEHGIDTEAGQLLLSRYLAQLGELLHYEKGEGSLGESLLLDLDWVTKSVYGITGDQTIIDAHGRFREEQIVTYWKSIGIDKQRDRKLMLALLQTDAFELCWRTSDGTFLTPTLFHVEEPKLSVRTDLGLRFNYHYLPKGLLGQAIVRLHHYLETPESFWRYGAYLAHDGCRARIARSLPGYEDSSFITIDIEGDAPQSYALLSRISEAFEVIHQTSFPRIRVRREIPCPCERCADPNRERHFFSYIQLEQLHKDGDAKVHCVNNLSTSIDTLLLGLDQLSRPDQMITVTRAIKFVEQGKLEEALVFLQEHYPSTDLASISASWHQLQSEQMQGVRSQADITLARNQINHRLLLFLNVLKDQPSLGNREDFRPFTRSASEDALRDLRDQLSRIEETTTDTNLRVRTLQESLGDVQTDLRNQADDPFTDRSERRAFFRKFEAYLETLPDDIPQPLDDPAYENAKMKDKIKIGIDAMKLLSRATGVEVDGFSLKWEREFEKGTLRLPRTWEELKTVFIG